jgi:hypothetical protein
MSFSDQLGGLNCRDYPDRMPVDDVPTGKDNLKNLAAEREIEGGS